MIIVVEAKTVSVTVNSAVKSWTTSPKMFVEFSNFIVLSWLEQSRTFAQ